MSSEVAVKSLTYVETDLDVYRVTIFENEPIAVGLPRNWIAPNSTNHTASIVANSAMPSGRALRVVKTAGNLSSFVWTAPPSIRDASAVALFRISSTATSLGVILRESGGDGTDTGYYAVLSANVNVIVGKVVAGVATSLATTAFPHVAGENLWLRFDALNVTGGVLLRAKAWRGEVDEEPEDFLASFTETTTVLSAGGNGIFAVFNNSPDFVLGLFRVRSLFSQATETLRFTKSAAYLPADIDAIPSLLEVQVSPGAISLGENLGERATITAAFKDHKHADLGELFERGSYWGKFRGRQLFRRGEPIRMLRGFLGQTLAQMETRHYVLDSFSGPSFVGAFQLVGKDPLKLADDDRALAPRPNNGFLVANVLATATQFTLSPGGIGDAEYPSSGYVAVGGKEIMAFQRGGNDSFTKAMLHFDGVDASTTFTDSNVGGSAHTWTAVGNAQLDTADFKFGTASGLFDGIGDSITTPDSADFSLGSQNFTIECWFKVNVGADASFRFICGQSNAASSVRSWMVYRGNTNLMSADFWSGGAFAFSVSSTSIFTNAVNVGWHHIAVVRSGTSVKMYIDGVLEGSTTTSASIDDIANLVAIGGLGETTGTWQGWIDEFRLSVGTARYVSNFLPIGPFNASSDAMSVTGFRGQFGTTAIDHSAEDRVQLCLLYTAQTPAFIINDLFVNYAGIPQAYVSLANWEVECDAFLDRLYTKVIADPEGVQALVSRLIAQAGLAVWWDAVTQQIRLQVLRGVSTDAFLYDQSNVLTGSISVVEQPDKRITQVWNYYGVRNPLSPLDQQDNYRSGLVTVDLETELLHGGAVIKTIYSDWVPAFGRQTAQRANDLQIGRFKNPPRRVGFETMRYSGVLDPDLGGGYRLGYWGAQNEYGADTIIPIQVTRLNPMVDRFVVEAEEMLFTAQAAADLINRSIVFDSNVNSVNLRSVHDSIYPAPTAQDVIDGVNLTVTVIGGIVVGSDAAATPALDVGTWPVGFPITIVVAANARIEGAGGAGADGGNIFGASPGEQGGTALFSRKAISLNLSAGGKVFGGGGGGGGGGGFLAQGGGGGGGAGKEGGPAGLSNNGAATPGTLDAGGVGGFGASGSGNGGPGGSPGIAGGVGTNGNGTAVAPGVAGNGIDGVSFVTITLGSGSILGPQIN